LGLEEMFFEALCDNGDNTLKTMHYPPVRKDLKGVRMMAHTDLEIVTLLLQDEAGGLELKNTNGKWVNAIPVPGVHLIPG
jgi:isopenicillin N synthase-like dioxygenase